MNHINKINSLELTRHQNFLDGRVDMFDLLASSKSKTDIEIKPSEHVLRADKSKGL